MTLMKGITSPETPVATGRPVLVKGEAFNRPLLSMKMILKQAAGAIAEAGYANIEFLKSAGAFAKAVARISHETQQIVNSMAPHLKRLEIAQYVSAVVTNVASTLTCAIGAAPANATFKDKALVMVQNAHNGLQIVDRGSKAITGMITAQGTIYTSSAEAQVMTNEQASKMLGDASISQSKQSTHELQRQAENGRYLSSFVENTTESQKAKFKRVS